MNDDALPLFRRICRMLSSRGDRGLTLEEIRDVAGLAEAVVAPDSRRIDAFALRLELSGHELEAVVRSEEQHGESAGPAPRTTTITGPSTPQDSPRARTRVCGCLRGAHAERIRRPARATSSSNGRNGIR